jgi:ATP-binding cassette subfamily F protein uup
LDLDTLQALETYLQEFDGVLVIVSHDRLFADKVTDHLFIFEGDGEIKDYSGSLSEYAATLVELESDSSSATTAPQEGRKAANQEDKVKRNEQRNAVRRAKKDIDNLEKAIDKLKKKAASLQEKINGSGEEGWSVLADLTDQLTAVNGDIEEKEIDWMEVAEQLEEAEVEL